MNKLKKIIFILIKYGARYFFSLLATRLIQKIGLLDSIQLMRDRISIDAKDIFRNKVAYGPFKGMQFGEKIYWGKRDLLTKYLGQYEPQIIEKLIKYSKDYNHFIDIGAADGYFAIGLLHSNLYSSSTCFEISKYGRSVILKNAELNNVQKSINLYGKAELDMMSKVLREQGPSVILCDIEGGEYQLFNKAFLEIVKGCVVIIELHMFVKGEENMRKELIRDASNFFEVSYIKRHNPKVNEFEELKDWDDNSRHIGFSEGRTTRGLWLLLTPIRSY